MKQPCCCFNVATLKTVSHLFFLCCLAPQLMWQTKCKTCHLCKRSTRSRPIHFSLYICRIIMMQNSCWPLQMWITRLCATMLVMLLTSPLAADCLTSSLLRITPASGMWRCSTSPACTVLRMPRWSRRGEGRSC